MAIDLFLRISLLLREQTTAGGTKFQEPTFNYFCRVFTEVTELKKYSESTVSFSPTFTWEDRCYSINVYYIFDNIFPNFNPEVPKAINNSGWKRLM